MSQTDYTDQATRLGPEEVGMLQVQPYIPHQMVPIQQQRQRLQLTPRRLIGHPRFSPYAIPNSMNLNCPPFSHYRLPRPPPIRIIHHSPQIALQPQFGQQQQSQFMRRLEDQKAALHSKLSSTAAAPVEYVQSNLRKLSRTTASLGSNKKSIKDNVKKLQKLSNAGKKASKKRSYFKWSIGVLLLCTVTFFTMDPIIPNLVMKIPSLNENGIFTYLWGSPPYGVNICIYIFGIKNGPEFLKGARPHLEQTGPFCYYLYVTRKILGWTEKTVKSNIKLTLEYNPKGSLSLDTRLKMINIPIFGAVLFVKSFLTTYYLGFMGPVLYNPIVAMMKASGEKLIEEIPASEILTDRKIKILDKLDLGLLAPLRAIGIPIPHEFTLYGFKISHWQVGLTTTLSGIEIGPMEENRATEDGHLMGSFVGYTGNKFFMADKPTCGEDSGGHTIYFFSPTVHRRLTVIIPLFCRELWFTKEYKHYFYGVEVTRYKFDEQMFNASLKINQCFCRKKQRRDCHGWADMGQCFFTAPIGFSMPHFYRSPGNHQAKIDGLTPNAAEHDFYLDFETNIGVPVVARPALQAILDISPVASVDAMKSLPNVQLPLVWAVANEGAFGVLGVLFCLVSYGVRFGAYVWLTSGIVLSSYLFYCGCVQKKIAPM